MNKKIALLVPGIAMLSACVGVENATINVDGTSITGGTSSSTSTNNSSSTSTGSSVSGTVSNGSSRYYSTLNTGYNSDGTGIARGASGNGDALIVAGGISSKVRAANLLGSSNLAIAAETLPINNLRLQRYLTYGTQRSGNYTVNGQTFRVTTVQDRRGQAEAIFVGMPYGQQDVSIVSGNPMTSAPSYGTYMYSGTQVTTRHDNSAPGSTGTFALSADFSNGVFRYSGSDGVSASGYLNRNTGKFSSTSMNKYGVTGKLQGQMHGAQARSTSGVFYTNSYYRPETGAFVGSR